MVQNSNQILIDMKNIYEFRDIMVFSVNSKGIYQENTDNIPIGI